MDQSVVTAALARSSSILFSGGILSSSSSHTKKTTGAEGRRSGRDLDKMIVGGGLEDGREIRSRLSRGSGFRDDERDHRRRRAALFLKQGGVSGQALPSRIGNFRGESLLLSAGRGIGSRGGKMSTMTVSHARMEDTGSESSPSLMEPEILWGERGQDIDSSESAENGTYGGGDFTVAVKELTLEPTPGFCQWDLATARLADSATVAFLLLQLPQIILNTQNLVAGNFNALFAVPWMGQLTSLLGNLSLLSYFASKKERGAMVVQAVGVVSTLVVLSQLAIAGAMPSTAFIVTASVVVIGLLLNFLNYSNNLSPELWRLWGEVVSIGGVTVLPQVMWATFEPYIPHSILPGTLFGSLAVAIIVLARLEKVPPKFKSIIGAVSAWTATLLFMWAPVAQWWQNYLYPANIRGLSVFTILLAMVGNSLLLPRALFTRDLMWFTGSSWGTLVQGWGILINMYMVQAITDLTFWGVSGILFVWLSTMFWRDSKAFNPSSPLIELISGKSL